MVSFNLFDEDFKDPSKSRFLLTTNIKEFVVGQMEPILREYS